MIEIREYSKYDPNEVMALYRSVGWTNYTERPEMLQNAFSHSLLTLGAYEDTRLIGLVRVVGDGFSAILIQDILVFPEHQRKGVGTALIRAVLKRYPDVYQINLLTDNTSKTISFYKSLGFIEASDLGCCAFLK